MSDKQTTRCAASGAHLFARYALTCCENGSEGNSKRSSSDISRLRDLVLRNDPTEAVLTQILLCSMFPSPVDECFKSDGVWDENPADFVWLIDRVQIHWRYAHTGPKTDVVPSRPENGCRTIRAKVLRMHSIVGNAFFVDVEGQEVLVIDLFGLNPNPEEFVFFHQRVICEVEEPTDYLRTIGLDGGENQVGRAEPRDSEEIYEQGVRGGEVIRPSELPAVPLASSGQPSVKSDGETSTAYETSPVGLSGRYDLVTGIHADGDSSKEAVKPGEEPAPGNGKYGYLFPFLLSSTQSIVRADGDSVEVGIPATTLPPTVAEDCECGHECKGGHLCPNAPHYVQFRDPSDKVVSPGRVVGGQVLADKAVCGTETANDAGQLKLLVEEDYLPSSSPVEPGGKPKPVREWPTLPQKPTEKIVMVIGPDSPYKR